jgi:membrane-anchored protein YejM (alkaline phosphatase superfamily)
VIESYELAFRMQGAVPEVMDLSSEPRHIQDLYGLDNPRTDDFGRQCLLARRFAESGVRFIELTHANWDQHNGLKSKLASNCGAVDQPLAALLSDLDQRGMLEDTLVIWGGEFGRTPHVKRPDGRDHNSTGFSFWMAGGGVKGGIRHGATDENGISAVEDRMHFHDLHATILHLLGLDHENLTYNYAGRDFRLTDVFGNVAHQVIA